jgi:hypothetical protein
MLNKSIRGNWQQNIYLNCFILFCLPGKVDIPVVFSPCSHRKRGILDMKIQM